MRRANELAVRGGITLAVAAVLAGALLLTSYRWDFSSVWRYRRLFGEGILTTLGATAVAFALGLGLGVFVALARLSRRLAVRHLGDLYVEVVRGTPFLVQVWIAYYGFAHVLGVRDRFWVGAAALGAFAAAYMGEIFRAGIESVERGQLEAARSLGLGRRQALRHVVFPQAFRRMIPPLTGELSALVKESALLYSIGVFELFAAARQTGTATYDSFEAFLAAAALYLVITVPLSLLARALERRLARGERTGAPL